MTLQSSLEPQMWQIMPVFMVVMMIMRVFVLRRRSYRKYDQISFTTMFASREVAFHSSHVIVYFHS